MSLSTLKALGVAAGLALAVVALPTSFAQAAITDPTNDFLGTYTGPHNPDLDVVSVNGLYDATTVTLTGVMAGPIGTTPTGLYVWGVDRGAGTARFVGGTPSTGAGVLFDTVIVLNQNLTGSVTRLIEGTNSALAPGAVSIFGNTITVVVPLAFLPTQGFAVPDYGYNLWPRSGAGTAAVISDFAPDASTFKAAAAPEPGTWAMLIVGFGALGLAMRRQRRRVAAG